MLDAKRSRDRYDIYPAMSWTHLLVLSLYWTSFLIEGWKGRLLRKGGEKLQSPRRGHDFVRKKKKNGQGGTCILSKISNGRQMSLRGFLWWLLAIDKATEACS